MSVVVVGGQKFAVQFVHSGHDLKQNRGAENPGGFAHFVDDVAKSLNRRITLAEISLITEPPFVVLGYGMSLCYHEDTFVKEEGRGRALLRALRNARIPGDYLPKDVSVLTAEERDAIAQATGFGSYAALKARFGKTGVKRCTCGPLGACSTRCDRSPASIGKSSLAALLYPQSRYAVPVQNVTSGFIANSSPRIGHSRDAELVTNAQNGLRGFSFPDAPAMPLTPAVFCDGGSPDAGCGPSGD